MLSVIEMKKNNIDKTIIVPEGVSVSLNGNILKIKEQDLEVEKRLLFPDITLSVNNNKIFIKSKKTSRKLKRMVNTFYSHVKNMVKGVNSPYVYKLKVCSGHFPMKVTQDKNYVVISNFLGEKIPRKAIILPKVLIKIDQDVIILTGPDKEATAQSAANIEMATKITKRDRRVFQDGIFMIRE